MTNGTATLEPNVKRPSGLRAGAPMRYRTDWDGYLTVSARLAIVDYGLSMPTGRWRFSCLPSSTSCGSPFCRGD